MIHALRKFVRRQILRIRNRYYDPILKILRPLGRDLDFVYDEEFARLPWRDKSYSDGFCRLLMSEFEPDSVVDVGCGTGDMLAPFEARGLRVLGIDGSKANFRHRKIEAENFLLLDLRREDPPDETFDLCLCMEVAEHVEEKHSGRLVGLLTGLSDSVVFTAATPGQGGRDHVNEKPRAWWEDHFGRRGFHRAVRAEELLREAMGRLRVADDLERRSLETYRKNLMIFERDRGGETSAPCVT